MESRGRGRARGRSRDDGGAVGGQRPGGPPGAGGPPSHRGAPAGGTSRGAWGGGQPQKQQPPQQAYQPQQPGAGAPAPVSAQQSASWGPQRQIQQSHQVRAPTPQAQSVSAGRASYRGGDGAAAPPPAAAAAAGGGGEPSVIVQRSAVTGTGAGDANTGRGSLRGRRAIPEHTIRTRPLEMVSKKGTDGQPCVLKANYFELLQSTTNWTLQQYRVDFLPDVDLTKDRKRYCHTAVRDILDGYIFDGTVLYTPRKLNPDPLEKYVTNMNNEEEKIRVTFRIVGDIVPGDYHYLQVFNLIMRKCMGHLKLQLMGRDFFDPAAKKTIQEYKLEIWPGYDTSIRQHERNILMCCEIRHKVSRTDSVISILQECSMNDPQNFKQSFSQQVTGAIVITHYNNRSMRIDDIDWASSPRSTFPRSDGTEISYMEYYKQVYGIIIRNEKQPLLVSRASARELRGGMGEIKKLIPELCRMTGLTDAQRSNFQLMRSLAKITRIAPNERMGHLQDFTRRLCDTPEVMKELKNWDMQLAKDLIKINARIMPPETIVGRNCEYPSGNTFDWTKELRNKPMLTDMPVKTMVVLVIGKFRRSAESFLSLLERAGQGMSWRLPRAIIHEMPDDRPGTYVQNLETVYMQYQPTIVICVVSNNKADRYNAIKKKCCVDKPIPSQVICSRNLDSKGAMSIATKVAIQMNCKLGGAPWSIKNPFGNTMVIGYDVCHEPGNKHKSYGALVATMNRQMTSYYSTATAHCNGEELSNNFGLAVLKCLRVYHELNGVYPDKLIVYRDGVGEGDETYVLEHEVNNLRNSLKDIYPGDTLKLAFIIVTKRIRTKFFAPQGNPTPGTVVDDVVTRPERYDYYIVAQCVREGTVAPTNFNVIYDNTGISPNHFQRFTFKLTHMFFNWSGTVRVPAPCQYAHKLAFLVSQSLQRVPNRELENRLYYL